MEIEQSTVNPDSKHVNEHLANDRTYLAWIRTGVSMIGLGVVIAKLRYIMGANYPATGGLLHAVHIGLLFAVIGVVTIILSVVFFLQTQKEIRTSSYKSRKFFVLMLAVLTGSLGLGTVYYLTQPTTELNPNKAEAPGQTTPVQQQD
jgi:putative membrane protein